LKRGGSNGPGSRQANLSLFLAPERATKKARLFEKLVLGVRTLRMVDKLESLSQQKLRGALRSSQRALGF
jgi:hypothetical protein